MHLTRCVRQGITHVNFVGRNTLGSSPKMLARRLEPPGGSIYMYYGVSYHMYAFLFERTFPVIHCKTLLWSMLLTLLGSWTAPRLWSRYSISLRYISYFIFLLLCFSLVVVFGACYQHKFFVGVSINFYSCCFGSNNLLCK